MKYIFVAGAPGSKWSSVVKNIYHSASIDRSDYSDARTYYHDASGKMELMHLGAYFDPGMEFGDFFDNLDQYTKEQCETEFDRPFSGSDIRIIKSHVFAHHLEFIKRTWPDCAIVLVHRSSDSCLGWWVKCGHFDITYPDYSKYYENLRQMSRIISAQNQAIESGMNQWTGHDVYSNLELAQVLALDPPLDQYAQNYAQADIKVKII
ncbi:hypothetical protein [Haliscomenobacter sp.]|uniref:hypothetical protein n=1 Tax=Haliscomenobacter sp. TaxID=2717303 RepID=UPI003364C9DE